MIPPALAANFDAIALGWFTTPLQTIEFALVNNAATRLWKSATKGKHHRNEFGDITDRTRLGKVGAVVVSHSAQFGLGVADLRGQAMASPVGVNRSLARESVANDCTTT